MAVFRWSDETLFRHSRGAQERVDDMVTQVVDFKATQCEAWMRANASWTDRTSNARNGLRAKGYHRPFKEHGIDLRHSVPYGIYLETRFNGRYAIIIPAERHIAPDLLNMIARNWSAALRGNA